MPRRLALPGLPLRVSAQDRLPAAAARARRSRDALGGRAAATRSSSTSTCRSARCAAGSATCSPGPAARRAVDRLPRRAAAPGAAGARRARRRRRAFARGGHRRRHADLPDRRPSSTGSSTSSSGAHRRGPARRVPMSVETSPATATADRLAVLRRAARTGSASACRASSTPRRTPPAGRSAAPRSSRRSAAIRAAGPGRSTST